LYTSTAILTDTEGTLNERLTLAQAAYRAGLSYDQVRRLVLRREVEGGQDENGKWYVLAPSLDAMIGSTTTAIPA
jgi:hypothetical protein